MVRRHLQRLHYRWKGFLLDAKARGLSLRGLLPKFSGEPYHRKKMDIAEKIPLHRKEIIAEEKTPPHQKKMGAEEKTLLNQRKIEESGKIHPAHIRAEEVRHEPRAEEVRHEPHPEKTLATRSYYGKSGFRPYRREPFLKKISAEFEKRGLPPFPIMLLVGLVVIGAALSVFSVGIYTLEPKQIDVFLAVQTLDGNVLKKATIFVSSDGTAPVTISAPTQPDGVAFFAALKVSEAYTVYAVKDDRRIDVEDRQFKVPFRTGKKEIIIVKKAVS